MLPENILALLGWWRLTVLLRRMQSRTVFKEGEIWWCCVGLNIGREVSGKGRQFTRPVLIFRKFSADSFLGIPLTSQHKEGSWYAPIRMGDVSAFGILNQARTFDRKRLGRRMEALNGEDFRPVQQAFKRLYGL